MASLHVAAARQAAAQQACGSLAPPAPSLSAAWRLTAAAGPSGRPGSALAGGGGGSSGALQQQRRRRQRRASLALQAASSSSSSSVGVSLSSSSPGGSGAAAPRRPAAPPAAVPPAVVAAGAPYTPATSAAGGRDLDVPAPGFDSIPDALAAMAAGEAVVVLDDEDRENEGDLICAADRVTPALMAFIVRYTSGVVCVGMEGADLDRLRIPLMVSSAENEEAMYTAFTVTVDLREGTSTGISAADRAATLRALADAEAQPADFKRPGHIFPLRARKGGVLRRPGHTEASVDLCRLAGCRPAGVLCELVNDDGTMSRTPQLLQFAREHGLRVITIADLVRYRLKHDRLVEATAVSQQHTRWGTFTLHSYRSLLDGSEHLAAVLGRVHAAPADGASGVLARVHSESMLGDVFGAQRCDSGSQLDTAMERIAAAGAGVLVYLRGQQGRGLGLAQELGAYEAAEAEGACANPAALEDAAFPVDARDYGVAAHILRDLGVSSVSLMTNNPAKAASLQAHGIRVAEQLPLLPAAGRAAAAGHAAASSNGGGVVAAAAGSGAQHAAGKKSARGGSRNGCEPHFV